MAYAKDVKESVLIDISNNLSINEIHNKYNIPISTLYRWKKEIKSQTYSSEEQAKISKQIKMLTKLGKFDEAIVICKKFPDSNSIQSQYITILIRQKKFDEAIAICKKKIQMPSVQTQYINVLMKLEKFDEAIAICKKFPNQPATQSQYINVLMKLEKFKEAIAICKKFPNNSIIQSQYVYILIKFEKIEEAIAICKKFPECENIQAQYIHILIKLGKIEEAIAICKKYPEMESVQVLYVKILISQRKIEEAIAVCKKYPEMESVQTLYIKILIKQKKIEEAASLCEKFPNISIYYHLKKFTSLSRKTNQITSTKENKPKAQDIKKCLKAIKEGSFASLELEKLELTILEKKLLVIIDAYQKGLPERFLKAKIKELKEEYNDNAIALNTIKKVLTLLQKKGIFDIPKYQEAFNNCR